MIRRFLEWKYNPHDYFEEKVHFACPQFRATIHNGLVTVLASADLDLSDEQWQKTIDESLEIWFETRALIKHSPYNLHGPILCEDEGEGTVKRKFSICVVDMSVSAKLDFQLVDSDGNILVDSAKERLDREGDFLQLVAAAAVNSALLRALVKSYANAVDDPGNELVYLGEIVEALMTEFGRIERVSTELDVEQSRIGNLYNLCSKAGINSGRHRGLSLTKIVEPSGIQLSNARSTAADLVHSFARYLSPGRES